MKIKAKNKKVVELKISIVFKILKIIQKIMRIKIL